MHPVSVQGLLGEELGRGPVAGKDDVYKACIKRMNLDAMLGKSPLTIASHIMESRAVIRNAELINKTPSYYPRGPFPLGDLVGMGLAIDMELKLLVAREESKSTFNSPCYDA